MAAAAVTPTRKYGLRVCSIPFGVYDTSFVCVIGAFQAALRYVEYQQDELPDADPDMDPAGMVFTRPGYVPVLWLPQYPRKPTDMGALSHEALHVVHHILSEWAHLHCTVETQEAYCHAVGFVVERVLTCMRPPKKG